MKSLLIVFFVIVSCFALQAQEIVLQKGKKTRKINTDEIIILKGSNDEFLSFRYEGYVLSTTHDSLTIRVNKSKVKTRIGGTTKTEKFNYTLAPDIVLAKKDIKKLQTKRQKNINGKLYLASTLLIVSGISTTVYGAVANEEKASLIGLGQIGLFFITTQIANKNIYKLSPTGEVKKRWVMQ